MAKSLQFQLGKQIYIFNFRIGFTLMCAFFVVLFCLLGVWQKHRYDFKKSLLTTFNQRLVAAPLSLGEVSGESESQLQFQPVWAEGEYVNDLTMLVLNRVYKDQLGFEVLTPLRIAGDKKLLLVDRGWVQKPFNQELPDLKNVTGTQRIKGYLKVTTEYQFILGDTVLNPNSKPLQIQKIDTKEIGQATHETFYPFVLRLAPSAANGFVRDWTITAVTPERHMGYAVQWIVMAIVLFIAYFCFCCERLRHAD